MTIQSGGARTRLLVGALLSFLVLLAGCGGGGAGGAAPAGAAPAGGSPPPGGGAATQNVPPTATVDAFVSTVEFGAVTLSAVASRDSDGVVTGFAWQQLSGPVVAAQGASTATLTFTAPPAASVVRLEFQVRVTDEDGGSATANTVVEVRPASPPVGPTNTTYETVERALTVLDGSTASQADGLPLTFAWLQTAGPVVALSDATIAAPSFVAPVAAVTTALAFELTVVAPNGASQRTDIAVSVLPNVPPELSVTFPCSGCRLIGDATAASGTADNDADLAAVRALDGVGVTVDAGGTPADADLDGARWTARALPLDAVLGRLTATAEDRFEESATAGIDVVVAETIKGGLLAWDPTDTNTAYLAANANFRFRLLRFDLAGGTVVQVLEGPPLGVSTSGVAVGQVLDFEVDPSRDRAYYLQFSPPAIVASSLLGGGFEVVSGDGVGTGPAFQQIRSFAIDRRSGDLFVYDETLNAILAVDAVTGDRSILSDNSGVGTGTFFDDASPPTPITIAEDDDLLYFYSRSGSELAVDLTTGNRTAPPLGQFSAASGSRMFHDPVRDRLVLATRDGRLLALDLATGAETILLDTADADAIVGFGADAVLDPMGDRYVVNDFDADFNSADTDVLVAVDPDTAVDSELFSDRLGIGAALSDALASTVDVDTDSGHVYLLDAGEGRIVRIEGAEIPRVEVSGPTVGAGPSIAGGRGISFDEGLQVLWVLMTDRVVSVDIATGTRALVSGPGLGAGPAFGNPFGITHDEGRGRIYVADNALDTVFEIDPASGDRVVLSDNTNSGDLLVEVLDVEYDPVGDRLVLLDEGTGASLSQRVHGVNLDTGDRVRLSGGDTGAGRFLDVRALALFPDRQEALVVSAGQAMTVNLLTGDRAVIAGGSVDPSPGFGASFGNVFAVGADPDKRLAYFWDGNSEAVIVLDVASGARAVTGK